MKYWLIRLYPRSWRRRYETEFRALLEQHTLSFGDSFDILRGAFDAHWSAHITPAEQKMTTVTLAFPRRTVMTVLSVLLAYLLSYGAFRAAGVLVHTTQNRYTSASTHRITERGAPIAYPTGPVALFYIPLRLAESAAWPMIDDVTH